MSVRRTDDAAVSEVVGALLLVLIVTSAASAFAIFSAKQRERTEEQKLLEQSRALEKLQVLSVDPTANVAETDWTDLAFTVLSQHLERSDIIGLEVTGTALKQFTLERADLTTDPIDLLAADVGKIEPRERFRIMVDLATDGASGPILLPVDAPVTLKIHTGRLNTFERSFIPPTAVALVDVKSVAAGGGTFNNFAVLDASHSDSADPATRIVKWQWSLDRIISGVGTTDLSTTLTAAANTFTASDVGKTVTGPGIPAATTIASLTSGSSVELSGAATATGTVTVTIESASSPLGRLVKSFQCPSDFSSTNTAYAIDLKVTDNFGLFSKDRVRPDPYAC